MLSVSPPDFSVTASAIVEATAVVYAESISLVDRFVGLMVDISESRPVVATYRALTSPTAKAVYRFVGRLILAIGAAAMYGAFFAGVSARRWCDALVERSLQPELPAADPELENWVTQPTELPAVEPDPWQTVEVEPLVFATVALLYPSTRHLLALPGSCQLLALPPAPEAPAARLNAYQLRDLCSVNGIKWRNAIGKGKHLSVSQMRRQLASKGVMVA